jgi:UrcA family protein
MSSSIRSLRAMATFAVAAFGISVTFFAQDLLAQDLVVMHDSATGAVTRSQTVDISDLRLSRGKDRARLHQRIDSAARSVCDPERIIGAGAERDYQRCYNRAVSGAMRQTAPVRTASR